MQIKSKQAVKAQSRIDVGFKVVFLITSFFAAYEVLSVAMLHLFSAMYSTNADQVASNYTVFLVIMSLCFLCYGRAREYEMMIFGETIEEGLIFNSAAMNFLSQVVGTLYIFALSFAIVPVGYIFVKYIDD